MAFKLVVIGTSLGGLSALELLLQGLPAQFPVPLAVVQHRSVESREMLIMALRRHSALPVREPQDKEAIAPGRVYVAPADYHLLVDAGAFALTTEAPVLYARPSIDVLFKSASDAYARQLIGIVLTGASADGAEGVAAIKAYGGVVIVQDPMSAECAVMPQAALASGPVDYTIPLSEISRLLIDLCGPL